MANTYSAGIVTAYGAAVRGGYTGTYDEFCAQQAGYADNAAAVEQAKTDAESAATTATGAKNTAVSAKDTAVSAKDTAVSARDTAVSARDTAVSAKNTAVDAKDDAEDARDATQAVFNSIPEDYSQLSADVSNIKADLGDFSAYFIEKHTDLFTIENVYVNSSGEDTTSGNYVSTDFLPAYCLHSIYVRTATTAAAISFYDSNKAIISGASIYPSTNTLTLLESKDIAIPASAVYLRVSTRKANLSDSYIYMYSVVQNAEKANALASVKSWNLCEGMPIREYSIINGSTESTGGGAATYFSIKGYPMEPKKTYYAYSSADIGRPRYVNFYDSDMTLISTINAGSENAYQFVSPAGTAYGSVTFAYDSNGKHGTYYVTEYAPNERKNRFDTNGVKIPAKSIETFVPSTIRKPVVTFMLDTDYNRNDLIINTFESYGIHIGVALRFENLFPTNSEAYYHAFEDRGGEILTHSNYNWGTDTTLTDEEIVADIKKSYDDLVALGFSPKGFIARSGNIKSAFIPTVAKYYEYAATQTNHSGVYETTQPDRTELHESCLYFGTDAPFYLWRYSMETSTLDQMKAAVDRAISTNGFLFVYGHAQSSSIGELTVENVEALCDYIISKGSDIIVKTPYEAFRDYYSIRYEDVVASS